MMEGGATNARIPDSVRTELRQEMVRVRELLLRTTVPGLVKRLELILALDQCFWFALSGGSILRHSSVEIDTPLRVRVMMLDEARDIEALLTACGKPPTGQ